MDQAVSVHIVNVSGGAGLPAAPRSVALGSFDGLHLGHRKLLSELVAHAKSQNGSALVVSFYPHPTIVLGRAQELPPLLSLRQRTQILERLGVAGLVLVRFTEGLSQLSAPDFIDRVLINKLDTAALFVGPDAAFGRGRAAQVDQMRKMLEERGRRLVVVPHLESAGVKVGSRLIRRQIGEGDVAAAAVLLGAPFTIDGRVVRGDGRGKSISIPTANVATSQLIPALGVYSGFAVTNGRREPAVINVGNRPTFAGKGVTVEAHLFNYCGEDFYGKRIELSFFSRIRAEQKFSGVEALVAQIRRDIESAKFALGAA